MERKKSRLRTVVAFSALTLAMAPVLNLSAGAAGTDDNTLVPVSQGVTAAGVTGAVPFGPTDPSTPEEVSFILRENDANELQNKVESGVKNFLTVSQFAAHYGQSSANVNALTSYLSGFGITTTVLPDMIDVTATGTAGAFDNAMSVVQKNYHSPGRRGTPGQSFHGATTSPQLPKKLAKFVLSVLGLTNYSPFTTDLTHAVAKATSSTAVGASACEALGGGPSGCNLPADFESNYGLTQLEKHNNGSGQTIGIVTLAAMNPGAPQYFWNTVLGMTPTARTVTTVNVDGGSGPPSSASGSGETDLDVEQSGAIAPGANVIVYQAPNTDFGFVDAFAQAASQNVASSVSASWGQAESLINFYTAAGQETTEYQASFDEIFAEMAMQGQTAFVSAGDAGAYDNSNELPSTNLDVDSPGDSPYVTSAGGTTLPWSGTFGLGPNETATVTAQRAWGWDYLWAPVANAIGIPVDQFAMLEAVGGGGGYSLLESTPYYQQGVPGVHNYSAVPWLTPINPVNLGGNITLPTAWSFNPAPSTITGTNSGRAEPDMSANADPETGYLEYSPSFSPSPLLQGGWGGTSFVAPQFNGSAALIDSALGHRTGFWNPALYWAATHGNSPFTTLNTSGTSNDNLFFTGTPGTVYNPATGLGIPNLGAVKRLFDD